MEEDTLQKNVYTADLPKPAEPNETFISLHAFYTKPQVFVPFFETM
jgi:hypothetical protein